MTQVATSKKSTSTNKKTSTEVIISQNKIFNLWKPRNSNDGAAALFDFNPDKEMLFLGMMPQTGKNKFNHEAKITVKLGQTDIGAMLSVLNGILPGVGSLKEGKYAGLFHKNAVGNSVISFNRADKANAIYLGVSVQRDGDAARYSVSVNEAEQEVLRVYLGKCLENMFSKKDKASDEAPSNQQSEESSESQNGTEIPF